MSIESSRDKSSFFETARQSTIELKAETSIKRNHVKQFINAGTTSPQVGLPENDQNSHLSHHLLHLKTSCSGVKKQIKQKQLEQFKYKDETVFASEKVKAIQDEKFKLEQEIEKLKQTVDQVKLKKFNALHSFKSYEHVLDRMRKDEIKNQIKKNQLEKQLKLMEKQYKELDFKSYDLREYEYLSASGLKEAQYEVNEQVTFRKAKLNNMNNLVEEKQIIEKKKHQRKDKSDMIKEMAAGDLQDADLIRMKKFMTVQLFLKQILKSKNQKLKQFYEPYENAFFKIKFNTTVKDAGTLKSEYYNFETTYNDKSAWVKHLEEEIRELEQSHQDLKQSYRSLKDKELTLLEAIQSKQDMQTVVNKKELQDRAEFSEVKMMSINQWLKLHSRKMGIQYTPEMTPTDSLKEICQHLILKKAKPAIEEAPEVQAN